MSDTTNETTPVLGLTEDEARQLQACGETLRAITDRLTYMTWEDLPSYRAVRLGQVLAAAAIAEEAVFTVCNYASSYLGDATAAKVADDWHGKRDA